MAFKYKETNILKDVKIYNILTLVKKNAWIAKIKKILKRSILPGITRYKWNIIQSYFRVTKWSINEEEIEILSIYADNIYPKYLCIYLQNTSIKK